MNKERDQGFTDIPITARRDSWKVYIHDPQLEEEGDPFPLDDVKEQIIHAIGGFGKWQLLKCGFIVIVIWLPAACHLLNMVFFRAHTDAWCSQPENAAYLSELEWRNLSTPEAGDEICNIFDLDFESSEYQNAVSLGLTRPCVAWTYDRSFWRRTIIQEWDLVCDKKSTRKWAQQATFFGLLMGVFASGILSDRIGRVRSILLLITVVIICGTATAFAPSYIAFLFGLWACGFATIGIGTVMYCWMMELLAGREKTIFGCMPHINYAFAGLIVAGIAYLVPDWHQMELLFSLPWILLLLVTYYILPESPRWLLTHNHIDRAEETLRKIAEYNGKPLAANFKLHPHVHVTGVQRGKSIWGFTELFRTPNMRMKTLIIYYLWFATSVVYYGLTLNSNDFGASLFVYFSLGKAIEIPATCLVILMVLKSGRRVALITLFFVSGVALVSAILVPRGVYSYEWPVVALNILGRGSGVGCLCLCYVYSAEVFPTVVRNVGLGSSSLWARVGPMLVPYITELDYIEPRLPIVVFGVISLLASFLVTFLPETAHHRLPDTLEEGEEAGKGDTLWAHCCSKKRKN